MERRAVFLLLILFFGLALWRPSFSVTATPASYSLYESSASGWGFTDQTMSIPGPDLTAGQGETVRLTLTAVGEPPFYNVTFAHDFGVDYNRDGRASSGEPLSQVFGGGGPNGDSVTYTFTADALPGTYTYYCYFHPSTSFGKFVIQPGLPPGPSFSYTPASPSVNQPVTFDASNSSDPDGTIVNYAWLFGDGGSGNGVTVQHTYLNPGTYTTTLTVTDNVGLTNATSKPIDISGPGNSAPIANFTFTPSEPVLGQRVDFDASVSRDPDPGDQVASFSWDFGDGTTLINQTQPLASHVYGTFGTLQVSLTATDSQGASNQNTKQVNILPVRDVAVTSLSLTPQSVKAGGRVTIAVTIHNLGNVTEVFQIQLKWNSTGITSWPATVPATERIDRSYNWTAPGPGSYIITAKVQVSADDQNPQDNEKAILLTVEVQEEGMQGLPQIFYWSLAAIAVAVTGLGVFAYRRRHITVQPLQTRLVQREKSARFLVEPDGSRWNSKASVCQKSWAFHC